MCHFDKKIVKQNAQERWNEIFASLAPRLKEAQTKPGKHVPCPIHGGHDGDAFRLFPHYEIKGDGICNTCGAKTDGFAMLCWVNGWTFLEALNAVGNFLLIPKQGEKRVSSTSNVNNVNGIGNVLKTPVTVQHSGSTLKCRAAVQKFWDTAYPIVWGEQRTAIAQKYFESRALNFKEYGVSLDQRAVRYSPHAYYRDEMGKTLQLPCILSAIRDKEGDLISVHRTYLSLSGEKASVNHVKKIMTLPEGVSISGAAIRFAEPKDNILCLAEGVETALSVMLATGLPCWSAMSATMLSKVDIPQSVTTILIFADKDRTLTGVDAAEALRTRLMNERKCLVVVLVPQQTIPDDAKSVDWNDVLSTEGRSGFPIQK